MRHYVIPGNPIAWARVVPDHLRFRMFDKQKQEKLVTGITLRKLHTEPPLQGPLHLTIVFYMPIPVTKKKKIKEGDPHFIKPDLDNLEKYIGDCANKILYCDDCQIARKNSSKIYSAEPRIEFWLSEIK